MVVAAVMALPAGAQHSGKVTLNMKTYKSWQCNKPVQPYSFGTWACTTITVPTEVNAGDAATITYAFKAKTTLKYVDVCFGRINSLKCIYRHKYVTIKKGSTIKRAVKTLMPMVTQSGTYSLDNYTRFYKPPKYGHRDIYWSARSYFCIVAAGDEDFQCQLGK
jgi:hypothetical protein